MSERSYWFVVPARQGSTRLPGKNALEIFGEPLYLRAVRQGVEAGRELGGEKGWRVIFTTNCHEWREQVPIAVDTVVRPPWLSDGPTINAVRHALQFVHEEGHDWSDDDAVILLQPTSPFRTVSGIVEAVREWEKWEKHGCGCCLVSGCMKECGPFKAIPGTLSRPDPDYIGTMRIVPDGALYVTRMHHVWSTVDAFNGGAPYELWPSPPLWDIDIDTPEDWQRAKGIEAMLKSEAKGAA